MYFSCVSRKAVWPARFDKRASPDTITYTTGGRVPLCPQAMQGFCGHGPPLFCYAFLLVSPSAVQILNFAKELFIYG